MQVHVQEYSDLIRIRLQPVDADGNEISVIEAGQEFRLNVLVEDLREEATGVFGAWVDVRFDSAIASFAGPVEPGADYVNGIAGSLDVAGLIDEVGGFASLERVGAGERLLASIPLVATQSGVLDFEPDGADDSPAHDIGLFDLNRPVGQAEVQYVGAQLTVTGGLHNSDQATDTDGDGSTSPLDALRIVNFLNQYGPMAISAVRTLELQASQDVGEQRPQLLYDVNGDGHVTPLDVLQIVNLLNARSSGEGEAGSRRGATAIPAESDWEQVAS